MAILSDAANQQRNTIARLLAMQAMPPPLPVAEPLPPSSMSGLAAPAGMGSFSLLPPTPEIFPHSPTSSFDFAAGYSPAASTAAIGMFDPAGSSPTMQGGAPAPTGRDAFSGTPAQDWGGVFDPSDAATMTAPDMTASPHAAPTFDVDQTGMPNAPSFDNTPAPDAFGAGFASGFGAAMTAGVDMAGMGSSGDTSGDGVGGQSSDGSSSSGDTTGGSSGVG
jgi:hypothetical protein